MDLAIIGKGELAGEIFDLVSSCEEKNRYSKIYFVDLDADPENNTISEEEFFKSDVSNSRIIIAMGEPEMRRKMAEKYSQKGFKMSTFIHPKSYVAKNAEIKEGCVVFPFVFVSCNVLIESNSVIHVSCRIENDCKIGENCFLNGTYIGAKTIVENNCFIGPGSVLRDNLIIKENDIIGMGSVVTKSTEENSVYIGNPARKIRENISKKVFK